MTEYKGVAPLDPETDVGKFRTLLGDTSSEPYDPPVPGYEEYNEVSDVEIQVYLDGAFGNVYRALGDYSMALGVKAAEESYRVQDFDLQVSFQTRSNDYRRAAIAWWNRADKADEAAGNQDIFDVFPLGSVEVRPAELDTIPVDSWF